MSKEFKTGLITVVAGALLYYGFNFLRGSDLFSPTIRYLVVYPNVSGLNVSNPVYLNGLPVGRVSGFKLMQEKNEIAVSLDIDQKVKITSGTSAHLANDGLLGTKAIVLVFGDSQEFLNPGDTLNSETDGDLFSQLEPVADNINTTITKLNTVLDQLIATDIKGIVDTLKYSIGTLTYKANRLDIESTLEYTNELLISFKKRSEQLEQLLASSESLVDSLQAIPVDETLLKLNESLEQVNHLMLAVQSDSGTVGKLLNDDALYNSLNKTLTDLDALIIHFRNYPKDFMKPLGRKHKKLKGLSKAGEE
ncbi:MAG: MCE family protein [Ekhidna sp.]|nr:MCE family protein [Ekhidna sp.]MBC6410078.1 MCE family protein [Ekhidna sp.]MBC6426757.1 MCE family protein [Ekhidna sp.]